MYLNKYLKQVKQNISTQVENAISKTVNEISEKYIKQFDFNSHKSGLLLGNVQSGKTGHMLGILANAADNEFEIFIVLTTDSTHLQKQTFERSLQYLDDFCVCDEQDDVRFSINDMRKPVVIVLKKNSKVLETWKNRLISSKFLMGRPVFIIDDESDAASLNTKVNKENESSTINRKISEIRSLSNSSFYLQVTATPQSIFLQDIESGYKPEFVYYFKPGNGYLGGDFFYRAKDTYSVSKIPYSIRFTDEEELNDLRDSESHIPNGMLQAISSFLITSAHLSISRPEQSCNFLIHPSVSISDHEIIATKIGQALNLILEAFRDNEDFVDSLREAWTDLQVTKPDLLDFITCHNFIFELLEKERMSICVMNSKAKADSDFTSGINIIVGGNSLGRGVTIPNLQTTYYCRKTKRPQADTYWQHSRAFGYDRDPSLTRIFLPPSLFKLFSELNESNKALINYIQEHGSTGLRLIYPKAVNPTRTNVINKKKLEIISGGVNHFPSFPLDNKTVLLDSLLADYNTDNSEYNVIGVDVLEKLVLTCESEFYSDWPNKSYVNCIKSLPFNEKTDAILIVRNNRDIGRNTGTLLSPNDRKLGDNFTEKLVLTMYRIKGGVNKGWGGQPLWVPNIKFPKDKFFYNVDE